MTQEMAKADIQTLVYVCDTNSTSCDRYMILKKKLSKIDEIITKIQEITMKERTKRGIGLIVSFLFGIAAMQEIHDINSLIQSNAEHIRQTNQLVHNQTLIIKENFEKISNIIKNLETTLIGIKKDIIDIQAKIETESLLSLIESIVNDLYDEFIKVLNAVLFAKTGVLHPEFISLRKIFQAAEQLNFSQKMPVSDHAYDEFLKVIDLTIFYMNQSLFYDIKIPLLSQYNFRLVRFHPLPFLQKDIMIYIKPKHKTLSINYDEMTYSIITESFLNDCVSLTNRIVCKNTPLIRRIGQNSFCELKLATNFTIDDNSTCDIRIINKPKNYFEHLEETNEIIFSVVKPVKLNVICQKDPFVLMTQTTGIIRIERGCTLESNDFSFTMPQTYTYNYKLVIPYNWRVNLSKALENINETIRNNTIVMNEIFDELKIIDDDVNMETANLNEIIETSRKIDEKIQNSRKTVSYTHYIYVIIVLVCSGIVLIIFKYNCKSK